MIAEIARERNEDECGRVRQSLPLMNANERRSKTRASAKGREFGNKGRRRNVSDIQG